MLRLKKQVALVLILSILQWNCGSAAKVISSQLEKPLNIIFLIGDGMGLAQIFAASVINGGLTLDLFDNIGFLKTSSADDFITDSAAGATAFSIGQKTYNGAIGLDADSIAQKTLTEQAEEKGLATGLIATCSVTHATPASFYAHQKSRQMHKEIANDFYGKGIDFVAGSGKPYFNLEKLMAEGYYVQTGKNFQEKKFDKTFWFYNDSIETPNAIERGNWLAEATKQGVNHLQNNKKGFFLMVEGSQIDWGGHNNDFDYMVSELIDFDKAIKVAYEYAKVNKNTLVIVTADHETGGLSINGGSLKNKTITKPKFATDHHSAIMVPVYAFGPGAEKFRGTMENTAIYKNIKTLLNL